MLWLVGAIGTLALFGIFAWVARRLLGVHHLSLITTTVAALAGALMGGLITEVLTRRGEERDLASLAGVVLGLISTMVLIVTFEALATPRSGRPGRRRGNAIQIARTRIAGGARAIEVARIARRHGLGKGLGLALGDDVSPEAAAAYGADLRGALEEAGGLFVKLGQLIATRPDLIPPETAAELTMLHQDVAPAERDVIEPSLEQALRAPVSSVFTEFDWSPLGAGSLGQVYRARLASGAEVVVKVRRPGVEGVVERDLAIAQDLIRLAEDRSDRARKLGLTEVADEFAAQLRCELDFRIEAANTIEVSRTVGDRSRIAVPRVISNLSSETVLVLEYIDGEPVGRMTIDADQGRHLANSLFAECVQAMLEGRRFHADPHPGNVIITSGGNLALIDFGSTGKLDAFERAAMNDMLVALMSNEPSLLRSAAIGIGMGSSDVDPDELDRSFARLMADHLGPGSEPTLDVFTSFVAIANDHGLRMPAGVTEMMRALVTLQGTLELLSPGYPIIDTARSMANDALAYPLTPDHLTEEVKAEMIRIAPVLRRMPHHLDRIATQLEHGSLEFRTRLFSNADDVHLLSHLVNRAVLAFIGATLGIVSVMLFQIDGPHLSRSVNLFDLLGFVGLFSGAILIMRVVLEVLRER